MVRRLTILYLSYKEVKHGAQKTLLSDSLFRPVRGLWYLSGYVLSREGLGSSSASCHVGTCRPMDQPPVRSAQCTGDPTLNHHAALGYWLHQRILSAPRTYKDRSDRQRACSPLSRSAIGETVFAFGPEGSGLSSLAMALSMLGYRCCSDLQELPESELELLLSGSTHRVFDAYVNIGSLAGIIADLGKRFPQAKFIATSDGGMVGDTSINNVGDIDGLDMPVMRSGQS